MTEQTKYLLSMFQWYRLAIVATLLWGLLWNFSFYLGLNDVIGTFAYAKFAKISNPESWYNAFFPVGNIFTLFFIPTKYIEIGLHAWNIFFLIFSILLMSMFFDGKRAFTLAVVTFSYPLNFQYAITPTADTASLFFIALAGALVYRSEVHNNFSPKRWLAIGLCIGAACLFRGHSIIFLPSTMLFCFIRYKKIGWQLASLTLLGFLVGILPQTIVNTITGHLFSSKAEAVNIMRILSGEGYAFFFKYPSPNEVPSIISMLIQHPSRAFFLFLEGSISILMYAIPALVCTLLAREHSKHYFSLWASISAVALSFSAALGGSPRFPLVLTVCYIIPTIWIFDFLRERIKDKSSVVTSPKLKPISVNINLYILTLSIIWLVGISWMQNASAYLQLYQKHNLTTALATYVDSIEPGFNPSIIYTSDMSLYFPNAPGHMPITVGGWDKDWLYNPNLARPIPIDSPTPFLTTLKQRGVKYLVLDSSSYYIAPFLFDLYQNGFLSTDSPVKPQFITIIGPYRIFRLV